MSEMAFTERGRTSILAAVIVGALAGGFGAYCLYWRARVAPPTAGTSANADIEDASTDVDVVMAQARCRRYVAVAALQQHRGNVAAAVKDLTAGGA